MPAFEVEILSFDDLLTNEIIQISNFFFMELSMYNFTFILVCCLTFPFGYGFAGLSASSLTVDDYQGP